MAANAGPNAITLCQLCMSALTTANYGLLEPPLKKRAEKLAHHRSYKSFRQAIEGGCHVCKQIWDSLARWTPEIDLSEINTNWLTMTCIRFAKFMDSRRGTPYVELALTLPSLNLKYPDGGDAVFGYRFVQSTRDVTISQSNSQHTSSTASLGLAYQWYMFCRASHKQCSCLQQRSRWQPTRLLDLGTNDEGDWRLHVTTNGDTILPGYMTLSYIWGTGQCHILLLSSNIEELRRGQPIRNLPQTFQDAILVARRFSVRYLWIDRLCIMQDSAEDWSKESSMMGKVYANSLCNISAASSADPSEGLFRPRNIAETVPGVIRITSPDSNTRKYFEFDGLESNWINQIDWAPLMRRGWVFQERLLSPRVIHFSKKEILWECFSQVKSEGLPSNYPRSERGRVKQLSMLSSSIAPGIQILPVDSRWKWSIIVERYSSLELTIPGDKLAALSGLARIFQDATNDVYLAGLWRSSLLSSLCWATACDVPFEGRAKGYRAPSWSWASLEDPIYMQPMAKEYWSQSLATIITAEVELATADSTGAVSGGFIDLIGQLSLFTISHPPTAINRAITTDPCDGPFKKVIISLDLPDFIMYKQQPLFFLPLRLILWKSSRGTLQKEGLILQLVKSLDHNSKVVPSSTYVRVGTISLYDYNWDESGPARRLQRFKRVGIDSNISGDGWEIGKLEEEQTLLRVV